MRELLVAAILCGVAGCVDESPLPTVDRGSAVPIDPIGARVDRCGGRPPEQPVQEPALTIESNGDIYVILYPSDWDKYVAYMDVMQAWSNCIVYGVVPSN